jgi:hypothetical protein
MRVHTVQHVSESLGGEYPRCSSDLCTRSQSREESRMPMSRGRCISCSHASTLGPLLDPFDFL